ncbi:40S ribosomal protein S10 [Porphyridium purpureum]|uniref:40S ribosomal protein S10 n=1 Tax=Porphyridium purpureum TaxID=35688 RepID=A0A5J4Z080_PORPP|nr:40S ribosomal protein S10 [Porphyridium purpureum]|eukprot:POR4608..scf208_2
MLIPKTTRKLVYTKLFDEGVMVCEKAPFADKHMELADVPNLHVMKLLQSLESKAFVKGQFNWNHHYYFLTDEGIEYLRGYLNMPSNLVPKTHMRKVRAAPAPGDAREKKMGPGGDYRPRDDGYRSEPRREGYGGFGRRE